MLRLLMVCDALIRRFPPEARVIIKLTGYNFLTFIPLNILLQR